MKHTDCMLYNPYNGHPYVACWVHLQLAVWTLLTYPMAFWRTSPSTSVSHKQCCQCSTAASQSVFVTKRPREAQPTHLTAECSIRSISGAFSISCLHHTYVHSLHVNDPQWSAHTCAAAGASVHFLPTGRDCLAGALVWSGLCSTTVLQVTHASETAHPQGRLLLDAMAYVVW
jgi:hypothetical protein